MRLSKTALFAASILTATILPAADFNFGTEIYNTNLRIEDGDRAIFTDNNGAAGVLFDLTGGGDFIKNGDGVLQYNGFRGRLYDNLPHLVFTDSNPSDAILIGPASLADLDGLTGSVTVNKGELIVAGYLGFYFDRTAVDEAFRASYQGVKGVILNDTSKLSFNNTPKNIAAGLPAAFVGVSNNAVLTYNYNVIKNLQAGGSAGGANTQLDAGANSSYRVLVHIDNDNAASNEALGSIGRIGGLGDFIKSGRDELKILNSSLSNLGRVIIADGSVRLSDPNGNALATATSVNLVGVEPGSPNSDMRGMVMRGIHKLNDPQGDAIPNFWMPGYAPSTGIDAALIIDGAAGQTIRNLQADFAMNAAPLPSQSRSLTSAIFNSITQLNAGEPYTPGTGLGTRIILNNNRLRVLQNRDGIYTGTVVGNGTVEFDIAENHRFAFLPAASLEARVVVRGAGTLYTNVNGIGTGDVRVDGNLDIFQANGGTLKANFQGGGTVTLVSSIILNNSLSGFDPAHDIEVNIDDQRGVIAIGRKQSEFTGKFVVTDGQSLQLGTGDDPALDNAIAQAAVELSGGEGRLATLKMTNGVQTLRSLVTDANSEVLLGSGSLVLRSGVVNGAVSGLGNFVVDAGAGSVGLAGDHSSYSGATVIKSGALAASGSLTQSSALILNAGAFSSNGVDQVFGSLYGRAGSSVSMGGSNLVIGTTAERERNLLLGSVSQNIFAVNYLSSQVTATLSTGLVLSIFDNGVGNVDPTSAGAAPDGARDPGVDATLFDFSVSGLGAATRRYLYNVGYDAASLAAAAKAAEDLSASAPGDVALANAATAARAAANSARDAASGLAFGGVITGSGNLVKIGSDTLILTGINTYSGATLIQGGTLRVDSDAINSTSGVDIAAGAQLELNATGDAPSFLPDISGGGGIRKIGSGSVVLDSDLNAFTGVLTVAEGSLEYRNLAAFSGGLAVLENATLILSQATDLNSSASITNAGTVLKTGAGRLALAAYAELPGAKVRVSEGILALSSFPALLTVDVGATLEATFTNTVIATSPILGGGTVLLIGAGPDAKVLAAADNLFTGGTLDLRGVGFDLNGTTQTLGGFAGDSASFLALNGGDLTINTPAQTLRIFSGAVVGQGTITKNGPGSASFRSTENRHWTGDTIVNEGELETTPQALGDSNVLINSGATLAIRNDDAGVPISYTSFMTGAGALAKTGAGEVIIDSILVTGGVRVREGRLTTGDAAGDGVFTSVSVAAGGTFQVNMSGARLHDSGSMAKITGAGSLAVSGAHTLTLAGTQSYTGNTELLNGATLAFAAGVSSLNGLAGDASSVVLMPGDLRVVQTADGDFAGSFAGTAGTLSVAGSGTLGLAGDLSTQAGLNAVVVDGGHLKISSVNTKMIENNGTLDIDSSSDVAGRYVGLITGVGAVRKTGSGKVSFGDGVTTGVTGNPYMLGSNGILTVAGGTLGGVFNTSGDLVIAPGGVLAPGNSPGTVTVNGDFTLSSGSTLAIELNATESDKVIVTGSAHLAGEILVSKDTTGSMPTPGRKYTILSAAGGITGAFSNTTDGLIVFDEAKILETGLRRVHLQKTGNDMVLTAVAGMRDVDGFRAHDGLDEFISLLDKGLAPGLVQGRADGLWGPGSTAVINNFSPLGYAAEYAMAQDGDNRTRALLHDRLEQLRYDRSSFIVTDAAPWEFFIVGDSTFVNNGDSSSSSTFDYKSYGGLVGIDCKMDDGSLLGGAIGYDNGSAAIHDNGGKIDMNRLSASVFYSGQLTSRWYLDLDAHAGAALYDANRRTVLDSVKSTNSDLSFGFGAETGTIIVFAKDLHFTPYASVAYTHHEFSSAREKGSAPSALSLDAWSQDSLRVKIGAGLNYFIPIDSSAVKFGVDVNLAHELLDTDSKIRASFQSGGPKFTTKAVALPSDTIGLTPNVGFQIDEASAVTFSYTYEVGFNSRSYQSLNLAFRARF